MTKFLLGVIVVLAVLMAGQYLYFKGQLEDLSGAVRDAYSQLHKLQPGEESKISIEDEVLTYLDRYAPDSVYVKQEYIPPEGSVDIIVQRDTVAMQELNELYMEIVKLRESGNVSDSVLDSLEAELDRLGSNIYITEVNVDNSGFCLEPEAGVCVSETGDFGISGGTRLFFYDRYGLGIEGSVYKPDQLFEEDSESEFALGGFGDIRIPSVENLSAKIGAGYNFTDQDWSVNVGINFYFRR